MTFGEKVKAERTKLGMSQDELAAKIGVTRRIIGSYENDKSRPRGMERYKKLAESLNVNVNYLLSEDDAFIADVEDKYGRRGARQAQELLAEVKICSPKSQPVRIPAREGEGGREYRDRTYHRSAGIYHCGRRGKTLCR